MIKLDVILFLVGICGITLGAALVETTIGAPLIAAGFGCMTCAPVVTVVERRTVRRGGDIP